MLPSYPLPCDSSGSSKDKVVRFAHGFLAESQAGQGAVMEAVFLDGARWGNKNQKENCWLVGEHLGSCGGSRKCPSTQRRSDAGVSSTDFKVFKEAETEASTMTPSCDSSYPRG